MLGLFGGRGAATIAVAATLLVAVPVSAGADSADAPSGGAYLTGADRWLESDCAGVVPIVVGSDAKAQSDIYSAITLAGAIGTDCVVLAGARDAEMPAAQKQRLEAAKAGGYVVGGEAAVPAPKATRREMTRIAGADRWITAQQVGAVAADTDPTDVPEPPSGSDSVKVESAGAHIRGAEGWFSSDCAGEVPIVVGSDANAQSDIYSAITLAGAIGTDCVVLAGARDAEMPAAQQQRLEAANAGGYVVGGEAAVPAAKIAGREMTRIAGADRWITAQQVGAVAASNAGTTTGTGVVRLEGCHPAYEPCLPYYLSDEINCGDLDKTQKPVRVKKIGVDPYVLDRDKNGKGCES